MKANAKHLAKEILSVLWDKKLPVNLKRIASGLRVKVLEDAALEFDDEHPGLSGMYSIENGQPVVRVNVADPPVRRRFTLAHELGHHCLKHGPLFRDPTQNFNILSFDSKEAAANKFAAELLMPEIAIKALIKEGLQDIPTLAKKFEVSEVAMKYRLKNLGWLS
jgi:Zn-dependent peptidase ImmA (M78 family)